MNKIMQEILTNADARDAQSVRDMTVKVMNAGAPWINREE
jgi:hypothetical protein